MSITPELLAAFDRILGDAEREVAQSNAFLASEEGRRQTKRSGFGWAPLAITIGASEIGILRAIRDAIGKT